MNLPKWAWGRTKHYQVTHGVTADQARQIASSSSSLTNWRKANGFTDIPGQCGYCKTIIQGNFMSVALANHRKSCKARTEENIRRMNSSSTLEQVINDSGPVLDDLIKSQEVSELRDQIQKLLRQNEQLKDSKANKLLAKSKSR